MIAGYPIWVVLIICVGVFCASFVDAIGGGGGIISVPVYLLAGLPPHLALGTNKMSAALGTVMSTYRYLKHKFVDLALTVPAIIFALIGSHFGTKLQIAINEEYLKYMLLVVLPIVAVFMLKQKKFPEESGEIAPARQKAIVWGASLIIGMYDGFYGPGTGTFLLLIFCNLAKMDLRTASGTVKAVNLASNVGALLTSLMAGTVIVSIGLISAVFSAAGHYFGAGVTIKNGAKIVKPIIFLVLGLLVIKVVVELIGG